MKRIAMAVAATALGGIMQIPAALACASGADMRQSAAPAGASTIAATPAAHYEWQYHYVGRHARLEGGWVLVK